MTTAIRVPESMHIRLASEADERELSINVMVVRAIDEYLNRLVPFDQVTATRNRGD